MLAALVYPVLATGPRQGCGAGSVSFGKCVVSYSSGFSCLDVMLEMRMRKAA